MSHRPNRVALLVLLNQGRTRALGRTQVSQGELRHNWQDILLRMLAGGGKTVLSHRLRRVLDRWLSRHVNVAILTTDIRLFSLALFGSRRIVGARSLGATPITLALLVLFEAVHAVLNFLRPNHIRLLLSVEREAIR